jgi:hypothetical protein
MHLVHLLLLAVFAWFALSTAYLLIKMAITTQDHFFDWATKKIAGDRPWQHAVDKLVIGSMVAPPALIFTALLWSKLAH